ncbi:MAG: J domain-containing protein [Chloroflexaceae bacterium]|nr:J domain-containing protein [Chloroflexaceae bacterium]
MEVRRAYWQLSKRYHPDTTELPQTVAKSKFVQLNEAYAVLSNPQQRAIYDLKIGYSRYNVIQAPAHLDRPAPSQEVPRPSYLGPADRPLSSGEIFVLLLLCLTLVGCLLLAVAIAALRGESAWQLPELAGQNRVLIQLSPAQFLNYATLEATRLFFGGG